MTTAKGLGGGFPISAMLTTAAIAQSLNVGNHGTTYGGGNPGLRGGPGGAGVAERSCRIGRSVRAASTGIFMTGLRRINGAVGVFDELRGKGLLLGCELVDSWQGRNRDLSRPPWTKACWYWWPGGRDRRWRPR
ncbi:MAG: aminotransferase class III-fold pyridoxal phosphate-dependent enzyme [Candidatus Competibacteraceae bacterium]